MNRKLISGMTLTLLLMSMLTLAFNVQVSTYASSDSDWLSGWSYRKSHLVSSAFGAGTDYQIKIEAHYGRGTDNGQNVYLDYHSRADFGDVRFTDDDGATLLDYWMEDKVDGYCAIFWVKIADDLSSEKQVIYIYYGRADETTTSNAIATFRRIIDGNTPVRLGGPLDETSGTDVHDESGNDNHGILVGGAYFTGAYINNGVCLDGVDDCISHDTQDIRDVFDDENTFSICFWMYPTETPLSAEWHFLFCKAYTSHVSPYYQITVQRTWNKRIIGTIWRSDTHGKYLLVASTTTVDNDDWTHIAMTADLNTEILELYVNGELQGIDDTPVGSYTNWDTKPVWGQAISYVSDVYGFEGKLDELLICDRVLSQDEITDLKNGHGYVTLNDAGKVFVRKFVDPEPRHGGWGVEEIPNPPIASFTFSPAEPIVSETVTFNSATSYDPDGTVISYAWDFGDGNITTVIEPVITHVYTDSGNFEVNLIVTDNDGLTDTATDTLTISRATLDVEVDVGSIHFRCEIAEFYILVSFMGEAIDAEISAILYYSNGNLQEDLSASAEQLATGLYRVPYKIPSDHPTGTYVLVVNARFLSLKATTLTSFLLSSTLTAYNAWLMEIHGDFATIETTLGAIEVEISSINAHLDTIEGNIVTIKTDIGIIKTDVDDIDARITAVHDNIAAIQTMLGTINGTITSIQDDIATIKTDIGTIRTIVTLPILSLELFGELDYLYMERVKIKVAASVKDIGTMEPISNADVNITIYDPEGEPWVSDVMIESLNNTGIYEWESNGTLMQLRLEKGVYLLHAQASSQDYSTASNISEFHIDPPTEESSSFLIYLVVDAIVLAGVAGLILCRRRVYSLFQQRVR